MINHKNPLFVWGWDRKSAPPPPWHQSTNLGMPNGKPYGQDDFFYPTTTHMIDSYSDVKKNASSKSKREYLRLIKQKLRILVHCNILSVKRISWKQDFWKNIWGCAKRPRFETGVASFVCHKILATFALFPETIYRQEIEELTWVLMFYWFY